jgi:hypothetical protein
MLQVPRPDGAGHRVDVRPQDGELFAVADPRQAFGHGGPYGGAQIV